MSQQKYTCLTLALCILAAVFYNSWPLGYVLNNHTAHYGLASDLELVGQPYYWVFVLGDILTGICAVAACLLIWFKLLRPVLHTKTWAAISFGLAAFGLFTAAASVVPAHCSVTAALACGTSGGNELGFDALFSIIATLGLLASLVGVCLVGRRYKLANWLVLTSLGVLVAYVASALLFSLFALSSGKAAEAQFVQQIFLIAYGLALASVGINIYAALWRQRPVRHKCSPP